MNLGFPYKAYRRSNEHDIPRPKEVDHEWIVVTEGGYVVDTLLAWPDGHEGWQVAHNVAEAMNAAYCEGQADVRKAFKEALDGPQ